MEETTSWKNHSFTLLIFGGIIVLCSIFFALGMVVGRTQGRHIADMAYAEKISKEKTPGDGVDTFKLNYFDETTNPKPDLTLQPEPPPERPAPPPREAPKPPKEPKPEPTKPTAASSISGGQVLQVFSTKDEKVALQELKRVIAKGFKARVLTVTVNNVKLHRVVVGPYKESEINLAKKDLQAKGYKEAFVPK